MIRKVADSPAETASDVPEPPESEPGQPGSEPAEANRLPDDGPALTLRDRLEAVLFASGEVMTTARLGKVLGADGAELKTALEELTAAWAERTGAIDLVEIAGGYRFMTRPAFHDTVAALARKSKVEKLSPAALETLAIVAYRQPLTRAEVETVRGVQAGPLLRVLLDRDLIRVTGRSSEPGHPLLYGTTKRFLDHFGLKSLKSLPDLKDLIE